MAGGSSLGFVYYRYYPSLAAAAAFVALFGLSTVLHGGQLARFRTWYFIPFVLGGLCETVGYVGRILSSRESPNWTLNPYIIQSLLLLIAPALFAASIYMILGRIIRLVDGARYSIIPIRWLTKIFVASDVVCFLMQGAGGGLMATAKSLSDFQRGEDVIIGGLFVQLVGFSVFVAVGGLFHYRILRAPTEASRTVNVPWQRYLFVLYAVSVLILIRSIFRVIEYIQGYQGNLQGSETYLYIFDAMLMFLNMAVLNVFHPSKILSYRNEAKAALQTPTDTELEPHSSNSKDPRQGVAAAEEVV